MLLHDFVNQACLEEEWLAGFHHHIQRLGIARMSFVGCQGS